VRSGSLLREEGSYIGHDMCRMLSLGSFERLQVSFVRSGSFVREYGSLLRECMSLLRECMSHLSESEVR